VCDYLLQYADLTKKEGEPFQCAKFSNIVRSTMILTVDPTYHNYQYCVCERGMHSFCIGFSEARSDKDAHSLSCFLSGTFGTPPNCIPIPTKTSLAPQIAPDASAKPEKVVFNDAGFGDQVH
jgi:hypothetical protein